MIKKNILTILPLTENFSKSKAGAVSLFIKDNDKYSKFNKGTEKINQSQNTKDY